MASVLVEREQLFRALSFCRTFSRELCLLGLISVGNGAVCVVKFHLFGFVAVCVFGVWSSGEDVQQPWGHCSYIVSMVRKFEAFSRACCIIVAQQPRLSSKALCTEYGVT
jgi:hypothetical protein